ncbi:MAG TPA: hypothetical protein VLB04_08085 [Methanotrichaceae archaeon]|nr:hypothetical protein [Methanotrichaceae archaeon]
MDEFQKMSFDQKLSFLIDNLRDLPDELAEQGIEVLLQAGETEYAVVLARDKGLIKKAIEILTGEGDYLWAALIAKNAGMLEESDRLYREGLGYYLDMEMYGRAVSAATALKLPPEEIEGLYMKGIEVESRTMDLEQTRGMLEYAMDSMESAILGRDDELSREIMAAIDQERQRLENQGEKAANTEEQRADEQIADEQKAGKKKE